MYVSEWERDGDREKEGRKELNFNLVWVWGIIFYIIQMVINDCSSPVLAVEDLGEGFSISDLALLLVGISQRGHSHHPYVGWYT